MHGATLYNERVCAAVREFNSGRYGPAAEMLETASRLSLHEYPNYRALPRLALAHARAGNSEQAIRAAMEARLSLEILYRLVQCVPSEGGFGLSRGQARLAADEVALVVAKRMCGEVRESIYEQSTLDSLKGDLPLIEKLFEADSLTRRPERDGQVEAL